MKLWYSRIKVGDIAWCRYPYQQHPHQPGAKPRPVLVLALLAEIENEARKAWVIYGTSQAHHAEKDFEWLISQESIPECRLPEPTTFDFTRRMLLPITPAYFPCPEGRRTPSVGEVSEALFPVIRSKVLAANAQVRG
jgi:hypothetical protein